jgi:hypothetical protein
MLTKYSSNRGCSSSSNIQPRSTSVSADGNAAHNHLLLLQPAVYGIAMCNTQHIDRRQI